jgi:hypothetical protein
MSLQKLAKKRRDKISSLKMVIKIPLKGHTRRKLIHVNKLMIVFNHESVTRICHFVITLYLLVI